MEKKKSGLSTILLVLAIILIIAMCVFMYMQKTEADRQIAELESSLNEIKATTNEKETSIKDNEIDIKDNENEVLNNEEVTALVTKFIRWQNETIPTFILEEIGYDNYKEIYDNTLQSYEDGDLIYGFYDPEMYIGYSNTRIKYSDFETKMCNYMTPEVIKQWFDGLFAEHNGFLYTRPIDAAGGFDILNVVVEFIYKNNDEYIYLVKYSFEGMEEIEERECIISIRNINNKNVVSGYIQ